MVPDKVGSAYGLGQTMNPVMGSGKNSNGFRAVLFFGLFEFLTGKLKGLVPGNLDPARIFIWTFFGVGPLHGVLEAVGVIKVFQGRVSLDAQLALGDLIIRISGQFYGPAVRDMSHHSAVG